MGEEVEKLKQRWPLLDYLQQQNWVAQPAGYDSEFVGKRQGKRSIDALTKAGSA